MNYGDAMNKIEAHFAKEEARLRTKMRYLKAQRDKLGIKLGAIIQVRNEYRRRINAQ